MFPRDICFLQVFGTVTGYKKVRTMRGLEQPPGTTDGMADYQEYHQNETESYVEYEQEVRKQLVGYTLHRTGVLYRLIGSACTCIDVIGLVVLCL